MAQDAEQTHQVALEVRKACRVAHQWCASVRGRGLAKRDAWEEDVEKAQGLCERPKARTDEAPW